MPKRYPAEQRERAVKMVLDHLDEYRSPYAACQSIGPKLGIGAESLRQGTRQAMINPDQASGVTTKEQKKIRNSNARSEISKSQRDPEISLDLLREGARPSPPLICQFIDQMRAAEHRVESICAVLTERGLKVAPRTYPNWKTAPRSERVVSDAHLTNALRGTVDTTEGLSGRWRWPPTYDVAATRSPTAPSTDSWPTRACPASSVAADTAPRSPEARTAGGPGPARP